jgi:hypothetical protein
MRSTYESFIDNTIDPPIRAFLHQPTNPNGIGLVLTHGAGTNCGSSLLIAISEGFPTTDLLCFAATCLFARYGRLVHHMLFKLHAIARD